MIAENKICPYPGLRPFNEEESIFFKGRDEHITQIVHQRSVMMPSLIFDVARRCFL